MTTATKLVPLEIGRLDSDRMELLGTPGRVVMPVPSWVVEHPRGVVLFDAGLHQDLQTDTSRLRNLLQSFVVDSIPVRSCRPASPRPGTGRATST
jgi:hypothetical protein